MKRATLAAMLVVVALISVAIGACGGDDASDPLEVDGTEGTSQAGTSPTPSPTVLSENPVAWLIRTQLQLQKVETAEDVAREQYPEPTASLTAAAEFAEIMGTPVAEFRFLLQSQLSPPPDAVAEGFAGLTDAVIELFAAVTASPSDGARMESALDGLRAACEPIQEFADAESIDIDLNCAFVDEALSSGDYYPAIEALLQPAHERARAARTAFDALPSGSSDEDRFNALSLFAEETSGAYQAAADGIFVLEPPPEVQLAQDNFIAAAASVAEAGALIVITYEQALTSAALDRAFAMVGTDLEPAIAAAEAACRALQSAATTAGEDVDFGCAAAP